MPAVTALCIYPVKSLKGINVTSAPICETGFLWDRQWMITRPDGRFLTQRQNPKMTLIVTSLPQEALSNEWGQYSPDAALTLNAPGMDPLHVPLKHSAPSEAELKQCTCWEWSGLARDEGEDAATWLTEFLGKPVRLVRYVGEIAEGTAEMNPKRRACESEFGNGTETMFADGYPYLLTTESSLRDLNSKVPEPMDMNRFRANIVIDDSVAPWEEDNWQSFTLGGAPDRAVTFHSLKPCSRCKVTTTNQETGEVGKEPLMALGKYRSGKALGWSAMGSWKHEVFFGWNLGADASGTIAVGDELKVTRTRTAPMAAA